MSQDVPDGSDWLRSMPPSRIDLGALTLPSGPTGDALARGRRHHRPRAAVVGHGSSATRKASATLACPEALGCLQSAKSPAPSRS
jgi:hypothetical protein